MNKGFTIILLATLALTLMMPAISGTSFPQANADVSGQNGTDIVAALSVIVRVSCPPGFTCPSAQEFQYRIIAPGLDVEPSSFSGSHNNILFLLTGPGPDVRTTDYTIFQRGPPTPHDLSPIPLIFAHCSGDTFCGPGFVRSSTIADIQGDIIHAGGHGTCMIDIHYLPGIL